MITVTARWRPNTEKPTGRITTALIAVPLCAEGEDDDGFMLLPYIYAGNSKGEWWNENTREPVQHAVFWWLPEIDLTAALDVALQRMQRKDAA
ncbi:MAG: hypothetical protein H6R04_726 [Burkholderiaceae bacterium]|nr:hypothetical protein [Burkholderiaceae bacterium]